MTNYGVYGTLISVDEDTNIALIETTPGTTLKIHRQTILKVVEPETETVTDEPAALDANTPSEAPVDAVEPEFGERAESEVKKPARKSAKKTGE